GLGVMGLVTGKFTQIWQPVPKWVPGQPVLAYVCAVISLGGGIGLLWRRSEKLASEVLFVSLLIWLLVLRLPNLLYQKPLVLVAWTCGATAVMVAGAWVLFTWFANENQQSRVGLLTGVRSLRIARTLYRLSLIPVSLGPVFDSVRPRALHVPRRDHSTHPELAAVARGARISHRNDIHRGGTRHLCRCARTARRRALGAANGTIQRDRVGASDAFRY